MCNIDDGLQTYSWTTVVGEDIPYTAYTYSYQDSIVAGTTYHFRYRANNALGAGYWSSELDILATTVPDAPPRPTLESVSSSTIELAFSPVENDGGASVTDYELWYVEGKTNTAFEIFTDYEYSTDGFDVSIDTTASSLTVGSFYVFSQ